MAKEKELKSQNPLILRCNRLMEAFAKSDDERDFYLDRLEGFIIYVDLDKSDEDIQALEEELKSNRSRYVMIPKFTSYETKKIMEGFVNEKVYDIDTKEKLLDIIQGKESRDHFLEFIYDHHAELEKWQQFYQERSRIRIIEWLRENQFEFVFEEDLELPKTQIEKLKEQLFEPNVNKDLQTARKFIIGKAKTYYSCEALNPRPKRGRPPKQSIKTETEQEASMDIYTAVPKAMRPFLFTPDISGAILASFSSKFETEDQIMIARRQQLEASLDVTDVNKQLEALRKLSSTWEPEENLNGSEEEAPKPKRKK